MTIPNIAPNYVASADLSQKRIITIARIVEQKRPSLLLEAFALLKDRFPDWTCEWYGERTNEAYWSDIDRLIHAKQLENRVFFPGKTDDVPDKLRHASIFAFPSAFAMGLPSVGCKDCCAVNSLIKDGSNGFLTDPTPEAFAEGLAKLWSLNLV